jgi:hypothetical protein
MALPFAAAFTMYMHKHHLFGTTLLQFNISIILNKLHARIYNFGYNFYRKLEAQ